MCGILVAYSKKGKLDTKSCEKASEKIFSRGPDYNFSRFKLNQALYLSQTVLSITGNPNQNLNYTNSNSGKFEILFNGEIYNFKSLQKEMLDKNGLFNYSGTDTETLVNLHEVESAPSIFKNLEGMFSYILFNNNNKTITIARDMIGEKVLYKYEDEDLLVISSQIAPILTISKNIKIDSSFIKEYFHTRHLLTTKKTIYKNLTMIEPGTLLNFDTAKHTTKIISEKKLSSLVNIEKIIKNKEKSSYETLLETQAFSSAAKLISPDINYFSVISGGIDSSLVSKLLNEYSELKPNLICLQFPGKDLVAEDVLKFNAFFESEINIKVVSEDLFKESFDECYESICMPLPTHSFISQAILAREVKKLGSKIIITGDGGDEFFGGYEFYKSLKLFSSIPKSNPSIYSGVVKSNLEFNNWSNERLINESDKLWKDATSIYEGLNPNEITLQSILMLDSIVQLESVGIRASDTMSMMSSVESRGFFLTKNIMEFALNLSIDKKIIIDKEDGENITRPFMKELFTNKFNKSLLKPKQGFSGYPNESIREFVDKDYKLTNDYLEIKNFNNSFLEKDTALEWKYINCEYYLNKFKSFL